MVSRRSFEELFDRVRKIECKIRDWERFGFDDDDEDDGWEELEERIGKLEDSAKKINNLQKQIDELKTAMNALENCVADEPDPMRNKPAFKEERRKQTEKTAAAEPAPPQGQTAAKDARDGETAQKQSGKPAEATSAPAGKDDPAAMAAKSFLYETIEGNAVAITGFKLFDIPETITIPATIEGKPVRIIGAGAFQGLSMHRVILPETVREIKDCAFQECKKLTSVEAPGVTTIGDRSFYWCETLQTVKLPVATDLGGLCFWNCSALTFIDLPAVTNLGENCFESCVALSTAGIPKAETIGRYAFRKAGISIITIPPTVKLIPTGCFFGCTKLKRVELNEGLTVIEREAFVSAQLEQLVLPRSLKKADLYHDPDYYKPLKCGRLAVRGMDTEILGWLDLTTIVYCLPGSKAQQMLQKSGRYKLRPLEEFDK